MRAVLAPECVAAIGKLYLMSVIPVSTKVLITGASGYIGSHLVKVLRSWQVPVRCLVRTTSNVELLSRLGCELVYGDITDLKVLREAVDGVDLVFHLAGVTATLDARQQLFVNGTGTALVVRACAEQEPSPKLVYVSSVSAAGPVRVPQNDGQRRRMGPVSYYGYSKRLGEIEVEKFADRLSTVIVRPGIVFGDGNRELLPVFQTIERLGCHVIPGFCPPKLSLIYIHDLIEILIRASQSGQPVQVDSQQLSDSESGYYFAVTDENPNYWQLGRLIQQALGRQRLVPIYFPVPTSWVMGLVCDLVSRIRGRPTHLSVDKIRDALVDSWAYSSAAVRRDLQFQSAETLLAQLRKTAAWYREHNWL